LLPKICTQTRLPKTAKICAACTANWPMLPKNELQKNILYSLQWTDIYDVASISISLCAKPTLNNLKTSKKRCITEAGAVEKWLKPKCKPP